MRPRQPKRKRSISVQVGKMEFVKLNTSRTEWRDAYHSILSLNWLHFALLTLGAFLAGWETIRGLRAAP